MLTPQEAKKISAAFALLESHGIHMCVPGWFDLSDGDDAVEFVKDPDSFYEKRNIDYSRG